MAQNCDPNALVQAAACMRCIPDGMQAEVQTLLLAIIAGGSLDPTTLANQAKCFKCLPPETLLEVQVFLLCQIANK